MYNGVGCMEKIYIILMDTKTIPSRLVSMFTLYKYSHVAISFDKKCDVIYSFGRRNLYWVFNGGFVVENKDGCFFKKFRNTRCKIYEIDVTKKQYNDIVNIVSDMNKNKDIYRYDYLGIILRYLGINVTFKNKYVCSYFVAQLLEEANVCDFKKDTCFVGPKDFEKVNGFNLIYTGKYALYR